MEDTDSHGVIMKLKFLYTVSLRANSVKLRGQKEIFISFRKFFKSTK